MRAICSYTDAFRDAGRFFAGINQIIKTILEYYRTQKRLRHRIPVMARRIVQVEPGLLRIEQRLRIPGLEIGTDVSGPACIYALVQVRRGTVAYLHGDSRVRAPRRFALFLPPFSVVQASLERCDVTSVAVAFRPLASDELPRDAVLLGEGGDAPGSRMPRRSSASELLRAWTHIGRHHGPAPLAANAKTIIDREYGAPLAIGHIARRTARVASPPVA
jgi:hypothetical protein